MSIDRRVLLLALAMILVFSGSLRFGHAHLANVCCWPKADIEPAMVDVRYRG